MADDAPTHRERPARRLPIPAHVSPELQRSIAASLLAPPGMHLHVPQSPEGWAAMKLASATLASERMAQVLARFPCTIETLEIAGVTVRRLTPASLDPAKADRVHLHFHGGAYVIYGGEVSVIEGLIGAHYLKAPVLSVDYRMPPEHPFPAAVDDAVAVWREVTRTHAPAGVGVFGTSAGGGLLLAMALKLKALGLPLPGALAPNTPWTDLSGASDSYHANAGVDGVLPYYEGVLEACAGLYAGDTPLDDPLVSPVHGDFAGFPPTLFTTGTRDILLSDTVRAYRRMRAAGVEARLEAYEAVSHAETAHAFESPESAEAFTDIAAFFERHLKR